MPSTHLTLVLAVDEPLDVGWAGAPPPRGRFWANLAGLHTAPAEIHHGDRQRGVYLDLTPAGARALLGTPGGALSGTLTDLAEVAPDLVDNDYGGCGGSVADPEGNHWSFGSYQPQ